MTGKKCAADILKMLYPGAVYIVGIMMITFLTLEGYMTIESTSIGKSILIFSIMSLMFIKRCKEKNTAVYLAALYLINTFLIFVIAPFVFTGRISLEISQVSASIIGALFGGAVGIRLRKTAFKKIRRYR